jgi:hypothetical protein
MGGDAVGTLNQFLYFSLRWLSPGAIICLRQMFTILQKEGHLCAMLRSQEGDVYLACRVPDFTNAWFERPNVAHCEVGTVNSIGSVEITSASFRRDAKHTWPFTAPVHADGAGGLAMF